MLPPKYFFVSLNHSEIDNKSTCPCFFSTDPIDKETNDAKVSIVRTDTVNYLSKPSSMPVRKCDNVDKLETLWQDPVGSYPLETRVSSYVNERPHSYPANHYESPIKLRKASVISTSENDLKIVTSDRPQSYIDMQGRRSDEQEDLLLFSSVDGSNDESTIENDEDAII